MTLCQQYIYRANKELHHKLKILEPETYDRGLADIPQQATRSEAEPGKFRELL